MDGNWDLNRVPTSTDEATIDNKTVMLTAAATVSALTVGSGTNATTLEFTYDAISGSPLTVTGTLTINNKGMISHSANTDTAAPWAAARARNDARRP
ncbi:MAG: hypothetical protein AABZ57_07400, partial [Candidatus Margulisiibacteriota bacterium]